MYNHGDSCYGNRSEEVTGDGATVNMEMSLMNQSEDDDHCGGQEETRGSTVVLRDVVNDCAVLVITGYQGDEVLSKKH